VDLSERDVRRSLMSEVWSERDGRRSLMSEVWSERDGVEEPNEWI